MRIYRHSGRNTQPQEQLDIEARVWRFQLGDDTSDRNLNIIMDTCKPILRTRGIAWDADAQQLVMDAIVHFNPFFGYPFIDYLVNCLEAQTGPRRPYTAEETLEADAYDGTGFTTFDRSWTSVEERLTISKTVPSQKGVQVYEGESNDIV